MAARPRREMERHSGFPPFHFSTTISEKSAIRVNSLRIAPKSACRFLFKSSSGQFTSTSTKKRSSDGEIEAIASRAAEYWRARSEEHTSELQSQFHLVCRLLLEKKK